MGQRFWLFYWHRPKPLPLGQGSPSLSDGVRVGQENQVPTSWGRQRESRQDQVWKGRRRDGVPPRIAATEIGGQGRDAQGARATAREQAEGRGREEENQLHLHGVEPGPPPAHRAQLGLQPFPLGAHPGQDGPDTLYPDLRGRGLSYVISGSPWPSLVTHPPISCLKQDGLLWPLDEPVGAEVFSSAMMARIKPMTDPCISLARHL